MKQSIQLGDTGFFYPYGDGIEPGLRAEAEVLHVWSDARVNLRTADGYTPTSVPVFTGEPGAAVQPSGYYFVPHAKLQVTGDDASIEQQIQAKGLTAPRVTPDDLQANIAIAYYFTGADALQKFGSNGAPYDAHPSMALLTFCVLVLKNGFTVTGESAVACPENFDAGIGQRIARANAEQKLWPLMGYALRNQLAGA